MAVAFVELKKVRIPDCRGLVYRYIDTTFPTKAGGLRRVQEVIPRKNLSCGGCSVCHGINDYLQEFPDLEFNYDPVHCDLVEAYWVDEGVDDWETGSHSFHVGFRKYQPPEI